MGLREILRLLRIGWPVCLAALLAGTCLGALLYERTTPTYSAAATLVFSFRSRASLSVLSEGNVYMRAMMPSYVEVITSPEVLDPVVRKLDLGVSTAELERHVTVDHELDSVVVSVVVRDSDATRAATIANTLAQQVEGAVVSVAPIGAGQVGRVTATQITTATPADAPLSPRLWLDLTLGALAGLGTAAAALLVWNTTITPRIRDRRDVVGTAAGPVLGVVPEDKGPAVALPVVAAPMSGRAASYRFIQSTLSMTTASSGTCLAVIAPGHGAGTTATAANVAIAIAMSHPDRRVLLVDAHLDRSRVHDIFALPSSPGFTDVLDGRASLEDSVRQWQPGSGHGQGLSVLPMGGGPSTLVEPLASAAMGRLLDQLRADYDLVVLDCPPALPSGEGLDLAGQADGVVLVVELHRTRRRQLVDGLEALRRAGAHVQGVVLNRSGAPRRGRLPVRGHAPSPDLLDMATVPRAAKVPVAAGVQEVVPLGAASSGREKADGAGAARGTAAPPPADGRGSRPAGTPAPAGVAADRGTAAWLAILDDEARTTDRPPHAHPPRGRHIVDRRLPARGPEEHAASGVTDSAPAPLPPDPAPSAAGYLALGALLRPVVRAGLGLVLGPEDEAHDGLREGRDREKGGAPPAEPRGTADRNDRPPGVAEQRAAVDARDPAAGDE